MTFGSGRGSGMVSSSIVGATNSTRSLVMPTEQCYRRPDGSYPEERERPDASVHPANVAAEPGGCSFASAADDSARNCGHRGYQYRILAALDESGPASQADLGRISTNLDRSDVNAVIAELVGLGAVTRAADQADRRRNQIAITKTGQELLRALKNAVIEDVQQQVLAPLSPRERLVLTNLLARINP